MNQSLAGLDVVPSYRFLLDNVIQAIAPTFFLYFEEQQTRVALTGVYRASAVGIGELLHRTGVLHFKARTHIHPPSVRLFRGCGLYSGKPAVLSDHQAFLSRAEDGG
jgi:hypothetical protein